LPDLTQWGEVDRRPLSGIRKATAGAMSLSWSTIPHVTQFDQADITSLDAFRQRHKDRSLTLTAIMVKLSSGTLAAFPQFNASLDTAAQELVIRKYINIGVAVDTDRGLLVPVIRNVDAKSLDDVAAELADLAQRARARKATHDDLSGAGFTVTNLGGVGTTYFSPLVNWPQVAILGLGRARLQPVHLHGAFQPRLIMPLSLSYDHRVIDGADAARFLRHLAESVENPWLAGPGD
ncbi:MAG: 2-oxo acid dehydrogenase subunit E2, partial [Acidobacteriota bacterium]